MKIGFLQYTARWYQDKDMIATAADAGVAKITSLDGVTIEPGDLERLKQDIRKLRSQVDIVVVSHHNRDGSTPVQFGATKGTSAGRDRTKTEDYQKQFAHVALDTGADLVFGHGTHTVPGVEMYKGQADPLRDRTLEFRSAGIQKSVDGLVARAVIRGKSILRVSFVPVTRDANNDVYLLDPSEGEGAKLLTGGEGSLERPAAAANRRAGSRADGQDRRPSNNK